MKKEIYLDHAATTPVDSQVLKAMMPYFSKDYGNAGAIYELGRSAKRAVDASRKKIAHILGAKEQEIIFTGGGTESVNMAILGYARLNMLPSKCKGHIITTNFEHHAVLNPCARLENSGFDVTYLPVDRDGLIDPGQVARSIRSDTILVSVMYANNEIGTILPITQIGKLLREVNSEREKKHMPRVAYHSDACQAAGYLNLRVNDLLVDMLTINGSKIYGPKGIGVLYIRSGISLEPLLFGGGQERKLRPGTENTPAIVGMAEALKIASKLRVSESERLTKLRNYCIEKITNKIPRVLLNGHPTLRLPNNINFSITGIEGESMVLYLDAQGVCCATGSACTAASHEPSHVILALGRKREEAHGSLRITMGRETIKADIDYLIKILPGIVKRLRSMSALEKK